MRITLIGDVHGKTNQYQKMLRQKYAGQRTFQLGDMGIGFKNTPGLHKDIMVGGDHKWIRGNHDDPEKCAMMVDRGYAGEYGYYSDIQMFFLGGAFSIDYAWRVPGVSWWAGEELSYPELVKAIELYVEKKPRIVATHEAPMAAATWMLTQVLGGFRTEKLDCGGSRTAVALQQMFDAHKPEEWVFGHYHVDKSFMWKDTKFTCVNELSVYTITDEPSAAGVETLLRQQVIT